MPRRFSCVLEDTLCYQCSKCMKIKPYFLFHERKGQLSVEGAILYRSQCIPCCRDTSFDNWKKRRDNGEHRRAGYRYTIKKEYGLSVHNFNEMYKAQGGVCAICNVVIENVFARIEGARVAVDHCHDTGKVRGLLCNVCNSGIGKLKDDPELLRKAIRYLENGQ